MKPWEQPSSPAGGTSGRVFFGRPASVGVLGFEHARRDQPVIRLWNCVSQPRE